MILSDQLYCRIACSTPMGTAMMTVTRSDTPVSHSVDGIRAKILSRTGSPSLNE